MVSINQLTIKRLFALSGNRCAYPGCTRKLIDPNTSDVTGIICHIKGRKGPRFDPNQTDEERNAFENLILLCPYHHKIIDSNPRKYCNEALYIMKKDHENSSTKEITIANDIINKFVTELIKRGLPREKNDFQDDRNETPTSQTLKADQIDQKVVENQLIILSTSSSEFHIVMNRNGVITKTEPIKYELEDFFSSEQRKLLQWYLEDYLGFPFGPERKKGEKIEKLIPIWGEKLFTRVFGNNEPNSESPPSKLYQQALEEGFVNCQLCIRSNNPEFLSLPWEIIRDPNYGGKFLALTLSGFFRQLTSLEISTIAKESGDSVFRILYIIPRPFKEKDIPITMIARPILEVLEPFNKQIQLEVLRPPSFEALEEKLSKNRGNYHLVHFDGHGSFGDRLVNTRLQFGDKNQGSLIFEKEDGSPDRVNCERLGQALFNSEVQLFIINACKSAIGETSNLFSSVATQLLATGARGVVSMSYNLYSETAKRFFKRFYTSLVNNSSLSTAVIDGRLSLYTNPERKSYLGPLALMDWIIPTIYLKDVDFIPIQKKREIHPEVTKRIPEQRKMIERITPGKFGFVGRDFDILSLERMIKDKNIPWIVINGMGGIGKTELGFGFARWYYNTGGCPKGVYYSSFKERTDIIQVLYSVTGYSTKFTRLSEKDHNDWVVNYLYDNPCLLIWDNYESVTGYSTEVEALATEKDKKQLVNLLKRLRGGKTRVIITTRRSEETWLGINYQLYNVCGLGVSDTRELSRKILRSHMISSENFLDDNDYLKLLNILKGHPRSLEVILPLLKKHSPKEIVESIQFRLDNISETIIDSSLSIAYDTLDKKVQKSILILGFFSNYVHCSFLANFTNYLVQKKPDIGNLIGGRMSPSDWFSIFKEAENYGIIQGFSKNQFRLHPTLTPFFRRKINEKHGKSFINEINSELTKFYSFLADKYREDVVNRRKNAIGFIKTEETNLLRALQQAERNNDWESIRNICYVVFRFYFDQRRLKEANFLIKRFILKDSFNNLHLTSIDVYQLEGLTLLVGDALDLTSDVSELEDFQQRLLNLLNIVEPKKNEKYEPGISNIYLFLGKIADKLGNLQEAEELYQRSLDISIKLGNDNVIAQLYRLLSVVAEQVYNFDEAEKRLHKALEISEKSRNPRDMAHTLMLSSKFYSKRHQDRKALETAEKAMNIVTKLGLVREQAALYIRLGVINFEIGKYDQSIKKFRKSLEVSEKYGIKEFRALCCLELGKNYYELKKYDESTAWIQKALEQCQKSKNERLTIDCYHWLGLIARERKQYSSAEKFHREALNCSINLNLFLKAGYEYHQIGLIKERLNQLEIAEEYYIRAIVEFKKINNEIVQVRTLLQIAIVNEKQSKFQNSVEYYGKAWIIAKKYQMRELDQILINMSYLMIEIGKKEFLKAWNKGLAKEDIPLKKIKEKNALIKKTETK